MNEMKPAENSFLWIVFQSKNHCLVGPLDGNSKTIWNKVSTQLKKKLESILQTAARVGEKQRLVNENKRSQLRWWIIKEVCVEAIKFSSNKSSNLAWISCCNKTKTAFKHVKYEKGTTQRVVCGRKHCFETGRWCSEKSTAKRVNQ